MSLSTSQTNSLLMHAQRCRKKSAGWRARSGGWSGVVFGWSNASWTTYGVQLFGVGGGSPKGDLR